MKTHNVKTWIEFKADILSGVKSFEVRLDDRKYEVGDIINHQFYDPIEQKLDGSEHTQIILYKLKGGKFGIQEGFCVLGVTGCRVGKV